MNVTALLLPPDDPDAPPARRITVIANQLSGMVKAGELKALPEDTRRALATLPICLLDIAGVVDALERRR